MAFGSHALGFDIRKVGANNQRDINPNKSFRQMVEFSIPLLVRKTNIYPDI